MTCSGWHSASVFPSTSIWPALHPCPRTSQLKVPCVRPCGLAQGAFSDVVLWCLPALLAQRGVLQPYGLALSARFHFEAGKTMQRAASSNWDSGSAAGCDERLGPAPVK